MTDPSEEEARAAREAMALHLWDEGLVRPESLAFAVVDEFIKEGWGSRVSTPPSGPSLARVLEAIAAQREWFTEASVDVLSRIKTETTEDVMLYRDAVSVLVAARRVYDLTAGLPVPAVPVPPTEPAEER